MTLQTVSQIILAVGILATAVGGFGSYYFDDSKDIQRDLKSQISRLQANFDTRTDLIFEALNIKPDVWNAVEIKSVPDGVADYLLLLFKSDKGRISGKVRIQGSNNIAYFSTTANSTIPVAVPNLWVPKEQQYKSPTILEFAVTQKTDPGAKLSIFTRGWIDSRGQEPH